MFKTLILSEKLSISALTPVLGINAAYSPVESFVSLEENTSMIMRIKKFNFSLTKLLEIIQ